VEHPQSRARAFLTEALEPHAHAILAAAWEAVLFGYAVQEVVLAEDAGRIRIAQTLACPFEWFKIKPDGTLLWRDEDKPAIGGFVLSVHEPSLRKPHGEALLAKAYWPWFFRTHGWRMWAKFLEQAAIPLMVGKTDGDKQPLLEMLRTLSSGPVVVLNSIDSIEALDQPGNSPNKFTEFETAICRRIQRLILGQTLTSGTDGGSGNRALGEVHERVRDEKRRADVRLVTQALQQVADLLADVNGLPRGRVVLEDPHGLERERAERDEILVKAGMLRFTRAYLEEKYGLEPDDFEEQPADDATAMAGTGAAQPAGMSASLVTLADKRSDSTKPDRRRFTAAQQAVEDEIERTLPNLGAGPIAPGSIASAIRAARDPEDLMERLAVVLADADDRTFRQTLERAMFAAEIMGYAAARREAIGDASREGR
jgi:phage gp29-like protein